MNINMMISFVKPYTTLFANRFVNGMGFGFGMGLAWKLQSRDDK